MPSNIEVKLRVASIDEVERRSIAIGATFVGILQQRDVFYRCVSGRLKLREIAGDRAELIAYARPDEPAVRASDYSIAPTDTPRELHEVLSRALGAGGVVAKQRTLLLWRNVRIHLDRVEGLGEYIEFESVVGDVDADSAAENLRELLRLLDLEAAEIVPVAYVDLLEAQSARSNG